MAHSIFALLLFILSPLAIADSARVLVLRGSASFGGKQLSTTSILKGKGNLIVDEKSYLKIEFVDSKTQIALGANTSSAIDLTLPPEKQELSLIKGIARWMTGAFKGQGIKTDNAILGVRGTDFFTSFNPALGETEVICFNGQIEMKNASDTLDVKLISKNQWGGLGGRFGKKLSEILTLSPELMRTFDESMPKQ